MLPWPPAVSKSMRQARKKVLLLTGLVLDVELQICEIVAVSIA